MAASANPAPSTFGCVANPEEFEDERTREGPALAPAFGENFRPSDIARRDEEQHVSHDLDLCALGTAAELASAKERVLPNPFLFVLHSRSREAARKAKPCLRRRKLQTTVQ